MFHHIVLPYFMRIKYTSSGWWKVTCGRITSERSLGDAQRQKVYNGLCNQTCNVASPLPNSHHVSTILFITSGDGTRNACLWHPDLLFKHIFFFWVGCASPVSLCLPSLLSGWDPSCWGRATSNQCIHDHQTSHYQISYIIEGVIGVLEEKYWMPWMSVMGWLNTGWWLG